MESLEFSYIVFVCTSSDSFTSSFLIWMAFYIFLLMQRIIQTKLLINTREQSYVCQVLILWAAYNSVYKKQHLFILACKLHGDFVCFVTEHPQYLEQHLAQSLYWVNSCRVQHQLETWATSSPALALTSALLSLHSVRKGRCPPGVHVPPPSTLLPNTSSFLRPQGSLAK